VSSDPASFLANEERTLAARSSSAGTTGRQEIAMILNLEQVRRGSVKHPLGTGKKSFKFLTEIRAFIAAPEGHWSL